MSAVPQGIRDFLSRPTPSDWLRAAAARIDELLLDHANCEKKAAATALALMFRYPQRPALAMQLSRLAREELRHFEQVARLMSARGISPRRVPVSSYAGSLRAACRDAEPGRLVDTLLVGALIEARSCERFALLVPLLPGDVAQLYGGLLASEQRHFEVYLELARGCDGDFGGRLRELAELEGRLATEADEIFAFHSGPPKSTTTGGAVRSSSRN